MKPTQDIIYIWSDGACSGNPGPGGWGTIIEMDGQLMELSGGSRKTTNNIMEMLGALEGIKRTPPGSSIVLTSDSQYLVKGMTQWIHGWKKKGWKKADGKAVLNKDIWLELDEEASKRTIDWKWIKGHAGHPENERCDELAREAIPQ
ncbi:MAG: ribonuclease HI [Proteobacteria bacterium]|nr:ribonuclease HI [Pseudomonadota bacterium]